VAARDGLYAREPPSPPLVEPADGTAGHLLRWEQHERDMSWHAWISWIQSTEHPVRHHHRVACVRAETVHPLEAPAAYHDVPRRTLGADGRIRPWAPASSRTPPGT
jgi:hypothetical protein